MFWYYLETSSVTPRVTEEKNVVCDTIDKDLLFRVSYYRKRINLEVNHALTDGTGTLEFLKSIVSNYLIEKHNIKTKIILDTNSISEKETDSFEKYYDKTNKIKLSKKERAYNLKGERYPENRLKIIEGVVPTNKIKELSKKYNTTVTVYLTSVLIKSIGEVMSLKQKRKPIVVTVPVNLRKYFKSSTVRNFFNTISVRYKMSGNDTLEQIIECIDKQFKEKLTKESLTKQMNSFALIENIFIVRLIPVFIKDIVLKYCYNSSLKEETIVLSNIGIVEMPKELQKYIKLFDVFASTTKTQICMCSYLDNMTLSFATHFVDSEIEKNFFKELSNNDTEVLINTNVVEDDYEELL